MTPPHLAWIRGRDIVIGSLFSGYGGLEQGVTLALLALGARSVRVAWVADVDPGASRILAHRYPDVPNLGDITRVDWHTVERVDIVVGGFPCQDVSHAGKRAGLQPDTRSGLWSHMAYIIAVIRPRLVVAENVRGLLSAPAASDVEPCPGCVGDADGESPVRALGAVLGDLADIGYDAAWIGLPAAAIGAPHNRFRVFVAAAPADPDDGGPRDGRAGSDGRGLTVDLVRDGATAYAGRERYGSWQDTGAMGRVDGPDASQTRERERTRGITGDRGAAAAPDPDSTGRGVERRVETGVRDAHGRDRTHEDGHSTEPASWGPYGPAVERWATVLGRPAPAPTEPGRTGDRLSPRFVEWMMGLPDGWVTDVPDLKRSEQLKALGNGVVPLQAAAAVRVLLTSGATP